jgi:phosphate uptake regulator
MSFGPGEQEVRKVQLTGGATYTLSLPKPWVITNGLSPRDGVRVDWRPSGSLRLTPLDLAENQIRKLEIDAAILPDNSLHDHLMGAYLSGVDRININYPSKEKREFRRQIRRFLRNTRGFETIEEEENKSELVCLFKAGEMPLHASLNRMYLQVSSLMRDIIDVLNGEVIELISDAGERESEVDALLYLIERQVCIALDSHQIATSLKLNRNQAVEYSNLARALERMMDHSFQMAQLIQEFSRVKLDPEESPMKQIPIWQEAIKQLMINTRTRDSYEIEAARQNLKMAQKQLAQHEEELMNRKRTVDNLLFDFRLSESVRRLCAYSRDFGEVLLNIKMYDEMTLSNRLD